MHTIVEQESLISHHRRTLSSLSMNMRHSNMNLKEINSNVVHPRCLYNNTRLTGIHAYNLLTPPSDMEILIRRQNKMVIYKYNGDIADRGRDKLHQKYWA